MREREGCRETEGATCHTPNLIAACSLSRLFLPFEIHFYLSSPIRSNPFFSKFDPTRLSVLLLLPLSVFPRESSPPPPPLLSLLPSPSSFLPYSLPSFPLTHPPPSLPYPLPSSSIEGNFPIDFHLDPLRRLTD